MHVSFTWLSIRRLVKAGLVLGLAYGWWVSSQFEQVNAVNQQELASAGTELTRALDNAVGTIRRYKLPERLENRTPGAASEASNPLCVFDRNQPFIELVEACTAVNGPFQQPHVSIEEGGVTIRATAEGGRQVSWRFGAATILTDLTLTDTFPFVFLADSQGKVLYQATPGLRRWERLLRWGDLQFRDSAAGETQGPRIQDLTKVVKADPDWGNLQAVTGRTTVTVGGQWHQLYTQPVATGSGNGPGLVLGALMPSRDIARQAFALDSYFMAFLVVALLLGALGVPFVKLASMSAHERFRMRDVYWLYASCASLLMLATFTLFGVDAYARWSRASDDGLAATATHLAGQIADEVSDLRAAIARDDAEAAALMHSTNCAIPAPVVDWFDAERVDHSIRAGEDADANPAASRSAGTMRISDRFKVDTKVFIRQQTWIDRSGQQIWKVSADKGAKYTEVADRPYFQAVVNSHLYGSSRDTDLFYIAPDRSVTDGKFYTFLAMRSKLNELNCKEVPQKGRVYPSGRPYVTVATGWLLSVDHVALPTGYGFALINREGRVLYHSDARLSLRENLFAQLGDGDQARAIVRAGKPLGLSTQYRGGRHRMQFEPLPWLLSSGLSGTELSQTSAGLWLVAFRDVSMGRAVIARAFIVTLLSAMAVLLVGIAVALRLTGFVSQRREGAPSRWLWPHAARIPVYRQQAYAYAAVILAFVAVHLWTGSNAVYLLLPVATAAAGLVIYARDRRRLTPRAPLRKWGWYATQFLLLVMGMVLIPAFAVFTLTVEHEFGKLIRAEQSMMSQGTEDAMRILKARSRSEGYPAVTGDRVARAHLMRGGVRWPAPYNAEPEPVGTLDRAFLRVHEGLDQNLPFDNMLTAPLKFLDGSAGYAIPGRMGTFGMLGLLAILYGLFRWIQWSAVRLHFADVESHDPLAEEDAAERWIGLEEPEKFVLMQIAAEGIANPYQRQTVLDLMRRGLVSLAPDLQPSSPAMAKFVRRASQDAGQMTRLLAWEQTHGGQNWRQVRTVLVASLALVALFLVITQPALQSQIVGIAGAIGALIASAGKIRDTVMAWSPFAAKTAKTP
jgi:hypothetical protein